MAEETGGGGDAVELLRDERERALETLRLIEEEGWTHHETRGPGATIRDVTAKRANRQRQIIERMDRLIAGLAPGADQAP
ncbi:MAG TPA: hypothetical protein VN231_01435 [Allosphingosinicella sp.]|nr:hypothetical protein [Allosphingosinicella sp.]